MRLNEAVATGTVEAGTADEGEPELDAEALSRALHEVDTDDGEWRGRDEAALDTVDDIGGNCSSPSKEGTVSIPPTGRTEEFIFASTGSECNKRDNPVSS